MQELDASLGDYWIAIAIIAVCASAAAIVIPIVLRRYRRDAERRLIAKVFKKFDVKFLKDVAFPDGMEGFVFIDYLLLTPSGIVVMDMQDYNGFIFGAVNIDHWTQMVRRRGFKFENPLHQNAWRMQVIRSMVNGVPVIGRVVFSLASQFPKGIPEGVTHLSKLDEELGQYFENKTLSDGLRQSWQSLIGHAIDTRSPNWKKREKA